MLTDLNYTRWRETSMPRNFRFKWFDWCWLGGILGFEGLDTRIYGKIRGKNLRGGGGGGRPTYRGSPMCPKARHLGHPHLGTRTWGTRSPRCPKARHLGHPHLGTRTWGTRSPSWDTRHPADGLGTYRYQGMLTTMMRCFPLSRRRSLSIWTRWLCRKYSHQ